MECVLHLTKEREADSQTRAGMIDTVRLFVAAVTMGLAASARHTEVVD